MLRYLKNQNYIDTAEVLSGHIHYLRLTPEVYAQVDELQKTSRGRSVLVAMKFVVDATPLREAIK